MKTLMALVLSLGMVLLGTAPVMAAGQVMQATAPLQQSEIVQVVVPEGEELGELDLEAFVGQKVIRTFQDFVDFVGKVAVAVATLGDDWSGNIFNDAAGIAAGASAGIDVVDTVNCYAFGKCN